MLSQCYYGTMADVWCWSPILEWLLPENSVWLSAYSQSPAGLENFLEVSDNNLWEASRILESSEWVSTCGVEESDSHTRTCSAKYFIKKNISIRKKIFHNERKVQVIIAKTHMDFINNCCKFWIFCVEIVDGRHSGVKVLDVLRVHLEEGGVLDHDVADALMLRSVRPLGHPLL